MKKTFVLAVLVAIFTQGGALFAESSHAETLSSESFLKKVRNPSGRQSWGILSGEAVHKRRGLPSKSAPIRFSVLFTPVRTVAQLLFNDRELYNIGQSGREPFSSSLETRDVPEKPLLAEFGIRPEDLTMNFIFWKFAAEKETSTVRGAACRVMDFEPEGAKESVRVYFSRDYFFPVKVEWFNVPASKIGGKPFRTLEIASFSKTNGLWVVGDLSVSGPGWRTAISFPDVRAGETAKGVPQELFRSER